MRKFKHYINESGIKNIKNLTKTHKEAEIWFHRDSDGVTSAIAMKFYIESYGVKVVDVHPQQYGSDEYAVPKGKPGTLKILVDFSHSKVMFQIHTDHHEGQVGVEKDASTSFKKSPSNVATISSEISPRDIFPPQDIKILNTVDSADFASQDLKPEDIFNSIFKINPDIKIEKNHRAMGLVVNKLLLTYKGKPDFLKRVVMNSKPSLISMYNVITKLARKEGYKSPDEIKKDTGKYIEAQASKIKQGGLSDVKTLKSGESIQVGRIVAQNNAGFLTKGGYDRYVVFKNHPDTDYFTILWSVGILQVSQNPFKKVTPKIHLGDLVMKKVFPKFKSKLQSIDITLDSLKYNYEIDIIKKGLKGSVGFTFPDLIALYDKQLKGLPEAGSYRELIADITNKPYGKLSFKQKEILRKVSISAWDVIMAGSGGHAAITNVSGVNFIKKDQYSGGYVQLMRDMQYEIVKEIQKL